MFDEKDRGYDVVEEECKLDDRGYFQHLEAVNRGAFPEVENGDTVEFKRVSSDRHQARYELDTAFSGKPVREELTVEKDDVKELGLGEVAARAAVERLVGEYRELVEDPGGQLSDQSYSEDYSEDQSTDFSEEFEDSRASTEPVSRDKDGDPLSDNLNL